MPVTHRASKKHSESKCQLDQKTQRTSAPRKNRAQHSKCLIVAAIFAATVAALRWCFLASSESRLVASARKHQALDAESILAALQECRFRDGCVSLAEILANALPLNLPKATVGLELAQKLDENLAAVLSDSIAQVRADGFHDIAIQSASRLPAFQQAWSLAHSPSRKSNAENQLVEALSQLDRLAVVALWTRVRVSPNSESWEMFFRKARAALLHVVTRSTAKLPHQAAAIAAALGSQAAKTEWMWATSTEEIDQIASLPPSMHSPFLEVRSMYGPVLPELHAANVSIENVSSLVKSWHLAHDALLKQQVFDPIAEQSFAASLPVLAEPQENTSLVVRSMYEADPYPRWESLPKPDWPPTLEGFMHKAAGAASSSLPSKPRSVLVLGCGTGHWAAGFSRYYPTVDVTAVDLSSASLGFAARKASELSLTNLKFARADLLGLKFSNESFDLVESSGVLHHLKDPHQGLAVVARLLRPGGIALLALYSRTARRTLDRVHAWIRHSAPGRPYDPASHDDLRRFRQDVFAIPSHSQWLDIRKWLLATGDFWSLSRIRDLVFHPVEHRFSPPELERLIGRHSLEFLRFAPWSVSTDKRRTWRARYVSEPSDDRNLSRWAEFEEHNPDTFQGMLVFFVQRRHLTS